MYIELIEIDLLEEEREGVEHIIQNMQRLDKEKKERMEKEQKQKDDIPENCGDLDAKTKTGDIVFSGGGTEVEVGGGVFSSRLSWEQRKEMLDGMEDLTGFVEQIRLGYVFSETTVMKDIILYLTGVGRIPILERFEMLVQVCFSKNPNKREDGMKKMEAMLFEHITEITLHSFIYYFQILIGDNPEYKKSFEQNFLLNPDYQKPHRLEGATKMHVYHPVYSLQCLQVLLTHFEETNSYLYILLTIRNLLYFETPSKNECFERLDEIMDNERYDENIRAEACDVFLQYGDTDMQYKALHILRVLGRKDKVDLIYSNSQNIHFIYWVEYRDLEKFFIEKGVDNQCDDTLIENLLFQYAKTDEKREIIKSSLDRIRIDQTFDNNLYSLLCYIINYARQSTTGYETQEILKRVCEELIEMNGTCYTGYYLRLVNAVTGYIPFTMSIRWDEQIKASIFARMRTLIMKDDNRDILLEEMIETDWTKRSNYREFFSKHIMDIYQELYEECKDILEQGEFDTYFRSAVSQFEVPED